MPLSYSYYTRSCQINTIAVQPAEKSVGKIEFYYPKDGVERELILLWEVTERASKPLESQNHCACCQYRWKSDCCHWKHFPHLIVTRSFLGVAEQQQQA